MIVAAAIKISGKVYTLPAPNRHSDIIRYLTSIEQSPIGAQGFIDELGGFYDREQAMKHVLENNQTLKRTAGDYNGSKLFTEDLW